MSLGSAAVKNAAPVAGVAVADWTIGGIDLHIAGAIIVGLAAGAVLRNSHYVSADAGWKVIRKDLLVSMMSGLANFIIAGIVVALGTLAIPGFPVLAAAGVGLFFGHQGPDAIKWFNSKFFGGHQYREPTYGKRPDELPEDMKKLTERFDDEP